MAFGLIILVPVLKDGNTTIWDTLAIAEYLYELYPVIWPASRKMRARGSVREPSR